MADELVPPFSARNRGPHERIDNDFPETARIALLYLIQRLEQMNYVDGWDALMGELKRIARARPDDDSSAEEILLALSWQKAFDFCERLYGYLAQDATRYNRESDQWELVTPKSEVQEFIAGALQRIFLEEHLAFEFSNGVVRRRGRRNTADQVARAELVVGEMTSARSRRTLVTVTGRLILVFLLVMTLSPGCPGYSVLTHEALIDAAWKDDIVPLLLKRFPEATPEDLIQAHAYVYGGAIIQDLGYYPFGNKFFSDLTHYVRSGDFVVALLEESKDLNEYAFALGALCHYAADTSGHPLATNLAVAMMYHGLAKKYGPVVTYEDEPSAHMKVEYGFDVDQVAKGNYAPKAYHDFIGFQVSKPVLERAFARTYSMDLSSVFFSVDLAIGSYRHAVSTVIPRMTKVAWHLKRDEIQHSDPSETKKKFTYNISSSGYRAEWGDVYEKPGPVARFKAFFLRWLPKIGPLSGLAFHPPTPEVEHLYMHSFNETLDHYRALLHAQQEQQVQLPDDNLDTGALAGPADYRLTDETYAELLKRTSGKPISDALRQDLLSYYKDLEKPFATKKNPEAWQQVLTELDTLNSMPAAGVRPGDSRVAGVGQIMFR